METSQDVRHRSRDEQDVDGAAASAAAATTTTTTTSEGSKERRMAMAKGGLRSLSVAIAVPLILTLANIYQFGTSDAYRATNKHSGVWVPPLWALHATCLASAILMGAAAWMFWAKDGLRQAPNAVGMYAAQMALSLAWDPLVFRAGANWAGLVVAGAVFGLLWRCGKMFRKVSPVAWDLVKPCLAWAAFLAFVSLKLILASFGSHNNSASASYAHDM